MSETARIREAARLLHRQRPEDTRDGMAFARSSKPTAIEMAEKYRELAGRAAMDLQRRIRGLEGLFGEDVGRPIDAAAEEFRELFYASFDQFALAHHDRDRHDEEVRAELLRYRAYLQAARHQEMRRRIPKDKTRPAWFLKSDDLFDDRARF